MTGSPAIISRFRQQFNADHEAHDRSRGKATEADVDDDESAEKRRMTATSSGAVAGIGDAEPRRQAGSVQFTAPQRVQPSAADRSQYTTAECQAIWKFGYIDGRRDWECLAAEALRNPEVFHRSHANAGALRLKFTRMADAAPRRKYIKESGSSPQTGSPSTPEAQVEDTAPSKADHDGTHRSGSPAGNTDNPVAGEERHDDDARLGFD